MITFVYGILAGIGSAISFGSFGEYCSRASQDADDFLAAHETSELEKLALHAQAVWFLM
jgi:hypothetical protein